MEAFYRTYAMPDTKPWCSSATRPWCSARQDGQLGIPGPGVESSGKVTRPQRRQ